MMKIVGQLLEHNELLNKCIKDNSFKIRATAKIIEKTEANEVKAKDETIKVKIIIKNGKNVLHQ